MGSAVGLVITPSVLIGIPPLRWIEREIIDSLSTKGLVVSPTVSVGVLPLCGLEWESIGAVVYGPIFITVGEGVHVRINAPVAVSRGRTANEGASIRLRCIVHKLSDVPKHSRDVEGRVVPVISKTVLVGIVPLGSIVCKGIRLSIGVGKPRLVAVETSGVGVRIRISI